MKRVFFYVESCRTWYFLSEKTAESVVVVAVVFTKTLPTKNMQLKKLGFDHDPLNYIKRHFEN